MRWVLGLHNVHGYKASSVYEYWAEMLHQVVLVFRIVYCILGIMPFVCSVLRHWVWTLCITRDLQLVLYS